MARRYSCLMLMFVVAWGLHAGETRGQVLLDDMVFLKQPANPQKRYETMLELARGYGLGYTEVAAANLKVDPWLRVSPSDLVIPDKQIVPAAPRRGIVINLADQRLYYFSPDNELKFTAPVGIGGMDGKTPTGETTIVNKREKPSWYPTPNIRKRRPELPAVIPPGPDNPLGELALYLGWPSYIIHDTNRPLSIGRRLTSGCIRLYPEHIQTLYPLIKPGTPVMVVDQPVKVGWLDGELYLQVHPSQDQAEGIEEGGKYKPEPARDLAWLIVREAGDSLRRINWRIVEAAAEQRSGIAVRITTPREPSDRAVAGLTP